MYPYNHGINSHTHATQGCVSNPACGTAPGYTSNPAYVPPPGYITALLPTATPVPTPTSTPPVLSPVQVPPGHYPIELVQFWRDEYKRGQPIPLHWALFVRTASRVPSPGPSTRTHSPGSVFTRPRRPNTTAGESLTPHGNFYELVGVPDTYTAQFLPNVTFDPDALADWRGTHVIGWVNPGQLPMFERVVRQVPVWRHRPDWRSQQWVYEVVRAVGGCYQGMYMDGVTFGGLQRHMGKLLDAWENGDI